MKAYGFTVNGERVSWQPLVKLFDIDNARQYGTRMVPKLTKRHINVVMFDKLNVALAAQVFSDSAADAIDTLVDLGQLPESSRHTSHFMHEMNDWFDIVNSRSLYATRPLAAAMTPTSCHVEMLKDKKRYFNTVLSNSPKCVNSDLPCLKGLKMSCRTLIDLSKELWPSGELN